MTAASQMLSVALDYAAAGIPVFPCAPGHKHPLVEQGLYDATTDTDQIRTWWTDHPAANIAMPTGTPRWDVVDVDVKNGAPGYITLNRLRSAGLVQGWSHAVVTPTRGLHLYFAGTEQRNSSIPGHGIDFRGTGGYVLVPPSTISIRGRSRAYRTATVRHRGQALPIDWHAIRDHVKPRPTVPERPPPLAPGDPNRRMTYLVRHVETRPEGSRHHALLWAAHRAVDNGSTNLTPLLNAAQRAGLDHGEAHAVITHVLSHRDAPETAHMIAGP